MRVECVGHINLKAHKSISTEAFWRATGDSLGIGSFCSENPPHTHSIKQKWSSSAQIPTPHHWPQILMILVRLFSL